METRRTLMRSLAVAVVIASVIWTTTAQDQKVKECCKQVSTAKLTDPILNIRLQPESLPCVRAVIFETERGEFCRDPRQPWVKEKVKNLRAQRNKPLTSTAAPTSSISDQTHVGGATRN